jgi:hypothetical protein
VVVILLYCLQRAEKMAKKYGFGWAELQGKRHSMSRFGINEDPNAAYDTMPMNFEAAMVGEARARKKVHKEKRKKECKLIN